MDKSVAIRPGALPKAALCLFVDFDGTLVDFAATPGAVIVDDDLRRLLDRAIAVLGGAVAIISGRPIAAIDTLLAPLQLPVAGIHGFERRDVRGTIFRRTDLPAQLNLIRNRLGAYIAGKPGLLLEDKLAAVAVHYRLAPQYERGLRELAESLRQLMGPDLELLEGDCVLEFKPASHDKASAIEAFLQEPPFMGRVPVFLGDDTTDINGFAAVRRHGGIPVAVGERVSTTWNLANPAAARAWLWQLLGNMGGQEQ